MLVAGPIEHLSYFGMRWSIGPMMAAFFELSPGLYASTNQNRYLKAMIQMKAFREAMSPFQAWVWDHSFSLSFNPNYGRNLGDDETNERFNDILKAAHMELMRLEKLVGAVLKWPEVSLISVVNST